MDDLFDDQIARASDLEDAEDISMELRLDFADLIMKYLKQKNWTQSRLAKECGISTPVLSRFVQADANCQLESIARVLHALGVRPSIVERGQRGGDSPFADSSYIPGPHTESSIHGQEVKDDEASIPNFGKDKSKAEQWERVASTGS